MGARVFGFGSKGALNSYNTATLRLDSRYRSIVEGSLIPATNIRVVLFMASPLRLILLLVFFIVSMNSALCGFLDGNELYLENQDQEYNLIESLTFPRNTDLQKSQVFQSASKVLVLADGFKKKWAQNAEYLQENLPPETSIYKTDIECPKELDNTKKDNLYYRQIDHNKEFPFPDAFFDVITMSYGLCICQLQFVSCGGINMKAPATCHYPGAGKERECHCGDRCRCKRSFSFFYEVPRVLNVKNPKSVAFLGGPFIGYKYPDLKPYENEALDGLRKLIPKLQKQFPAIDFKLVFVKTDPSNPPDQIICSKLEKLKYHFRGMLLRTKLASSEGETAKWSLFKLFNCGFYRN